MRPIPIALALAFAFPGCALLAGEGEETISVVNRDVQPVQVIVSVTQREGAFTIFGESIRLGPGDSQDYPLPARPGEHTVGVTTSTGIQEYVVVEIPEKGDTLIEVVLRRGMATVTATSRA